jgi:hypothetical protein
MSLLNNSESLFRHNGVVSDIIGKDRGSPAVRGITLVSIRVVVVFPAPF